MSQTLMLELPDDLYAAVERAAQASAQTPDAWLLAHLEYLLPHSPPSYADPEHTGLTAEEQALLAAEEARIEADWQAYLAEEEELRRRPRPSPEEARAHVEETLARWRGTSGYLSEEEAIELAMSEEIAEWNLDLD